MMRSIPLLLLLGALGHEHTAAQDPADPPVLEERAGGRRDRVIRSDQFRQTEEGTLVLTGNVTIIDGSARLQADMMTVREERFVEAEGNVLLAWANNRIFGTRLTYDLEQDTGSIENAIGELEEYLFRAKRADKVGPERVHLVSAHITTCTQPTPYWAFAVSSATITLDKYARMWNARLSASKVPFIYFPYMVWPVKKERALGLLFPEFQSTRERGRAVTQPLFIPMGKSADLTLLGRYYTEGGFGGGGELRVIPNRNGEATLSAFFINDEAAGPGICSEALTGGACSRYTATYKQTQKFRNGFRMLADINLVSDFDFYSDFEKELDLVSSPTILARLEFSRNGKWTSINVREQRREQLFSDRSSLVQQALPEIEWRGRSRRLGRSPFYLAYEASLASIQQRDDLTAVQVGLGVPALDAEYFRGDLFPTISLPFSRLAWLDVTPSVSYRLTRYTQSQIEVPNPAGGTKRISTDESLTRSLTGAGLEIVGPKFYRIFGEKDSPRRYKHVIEPRVIYGYAEAFDRTDEVLLYDEVDRVSGAGNELRYSLIQRLFARRARDEPAGPPVSSETIVLPDGTESAPPGESAAAPPPTQPEPEKDAMKEPVEIATLEFRQRRSFDQDLTLADLDGDGINEESSPYSNVQLVGRYNPSPTTSLDVSTTYHILFQEFSDVSVSGGIRAKLASLRFSLVHRNGLGVRQTTVLDPMGNPVPAFEPVEDDTQLRLTTGLNLLRGKLNLQIDGTYDANPSPGQAHVPESRWRIQYSTQCCSFVVEQLKREFATLSDRRDLYFRIDLRGIGKVLDMTY